MMNSVIRYEKLTLLGFLQTNSSKLRIFPIKASKYQLDKEVLTLKNIFCEYRKHIFVKVANLFFQSHF